MEQGLVGGQKEVLGLARWGDLVEEEARYHELEQDGEGDQSDRQESGGTDERLEEE